MTTEIERLGRLVAFMRENGIKELETRKGEQSTRLVLAEALAPSPAVFEPAQSSASTGTAKKLVYATMAGTFYRARTPDSEPFVTLGQSLNAGDPLGIIESMKMMNLVESEYTGTVIAIHVANVEVVEENQPLFTIAP